MKKVKVTGIKWDADRKRDIKHLSKKMVLDIPGWVEDEDDLEAFIEDELSNQSGFTHFGWNEHEFVETDKMKFSTVDEGLAKIKEEYINGEVTEGEFADYLVLNYSEYFDSSIEPVVAIQAIQEFRQWDYEMEGEDAIKTFGGTEALSDNGYYGFIFMRNGQSMQLPDGVRVGIQTEDGGIALDEGIVACFKETKCFNANDYTTHQLIEMEFDNLPDSEHKDNMIDEALQLVEECGYTVGEAANTILSERRGV